MLNAPPALKSGEKISIFSATKDFIEVVRVMVARSIQHSLACQARLAHLSPHFQHWKLAELELAAVTTGRSSPVCGVAWSKLPPLRSNKKREKDFACLGCTIIQSLSPDTSPHIICHSSFISWTNISDETLFFPGFQKNPRKPTKRVNWTKSLRLFKVSDGTFPFHNHAIRLTEFLLKW